MDEKLILVDLINDLTNENWDYCLSGFTAKDYFQNGGCYEFVQVLKHFYPEGKIMMSKDYGHCAYKIDDKIYDCNGICDENEFKEANEVDLNMLEDPQLYGSIEIQFDHQRPHTALINEIYLCFPNKDFPFGNLDSKEQEKTL